VVIMGKGSTLIVIQKDSRKLVSLASVKHREMISVLFVHFVF
jgi:hypothetical protein